MEFKYPTLFAFLIVASIGISWYVVRVRKLQKRIYFIPSLGLFSVKKAREQQSFHFLKKHARHILFACIILLLIALSARPQVSLEKNDDKLGLDIIVAVDGSGSMQVGEFQGSKNRIAAVQNIMDTFISQLKNDRVGLIAFSANFFTLCPLTHDYEIFKYYVDFMDYDKSQWFIQGGSTAVGDAIIYATDKFQHTVDRTKILILLTDGASNKGINPLQAAEYAKKYNVKVYTLLVTGDDQLDAGSVAQYKQIADTTDGYMYEVKNTQELSEVFQKIQTEEKKKIIVSSPKIYIDRPIIFILLSAFALCIYIYLEFFYKSKR